MHKERNKKVFTALVIAVLPLVAWFQFDYAGRTNVEEQGSATMAVVRSMGLAAPVCPERLSEETIRAAEKCLADAEEMDRPRRDGEARLEMLAAYTPLVD